MIIFTFDSSILLILRTECTFEKNKSEEGLTGCEKSSFSSLCQISRLVFPLPYSFRIGHPCPYLDLSSLRPLP